MRPLFYAGEAACLWASLVSSQGPPGSLGRQVWASEGVHKPHCWLGPLSHLRVVRGRRWHHLMRSPHCQGELEELKQVLGEVSFVGWAESVAQCHVGAPWAAGGGRAWDPDLLLHQP